MKNSINPASRLYKILAEAVEVERRLTTTTLVIGSTGRNEPRPPSSIEVWSEVFDAPDSSYSSHLTHEKELTRRFYQLLNLVDDVQTCIESIENVETEKYVMPLDHIRYYIPLTRLHHINNIKLGESHLQSLQFTSDLLARYYVEKAVDEQILIEILKDTTDLYNQIEQSDLENNLKALLMHFLEMIRRSIHDYKIRGAEGLKDVISVILGEIVLKPDTFRDSEIKEVGKFSKLFYRFVSTWAFAADTAQLLDAGNKLLHFLPVISQHLK